MLIHMLSLLATAAHGTLKTAIGSEWYPGVQNAFVLDDVNSITVSVDSGRTDDFVAAGVYKSRGFLYFYDDSRNEILWDILFPRIKSF